MTPEVAKESEMVIDWKELAKQVGDLNPDGSEKGSGTESGKRALEILIGEENLRNGRLTTLYLSNLVPSPSRWY